jgi:transcriptional regulator with XRE-family HTH domain
MEAVTFGQTIKKARIKSGLSLAKVGAAAGISAPYLLALENDEKHIPSNEFIKKISETLGLDYEEMLAKTAMSGVAAMKVLPGNHQEAIISFYATCVKHKMDPAKAAAEFAKSKGE